MTVCEACEQLCDGLGPYCLECREEIEKFENPNDGEDLEEYDYDEREVEE